MVHTYSKYPLYSGDSIFHSGTILRLLRDGTDIPSPQTSSSSTVSHTPNKVGGWGIDSFHVGDYVAAEEQYMAAITE